jgi:branched-chain amino acid transport system permease protein
MISLKIPAKGPLAVPLVRHLLLALVGLVAVLVLISVVSPFRNIQLAQMGYLAIAAGGMTVLTGFTGQLSLGHGAFMAVGAYTTALMLGADNPLPLLVVLLGGTAVALVVGAAVGVAAARLHGPYVAGATLALAVALPALALFFDGLGGEQGLPVRAPDAPDWILDATYFVTGVDLGNPQFIALLTWTGLLLVYVLLANLARTRVGRRWRAVRDDDVAAELAGIKLGPARVSAFVVSTACAGLAGSLMALSTRLAAPSGFTLNLSLLLLIAIVLGGLGSLSGALVGSALITFLPQVVTQWGADAGLDDIRAAELAPLVYGLTVMAVILLAPAGLVGSLRNLWLRRRGVA